MTPEERAERVIPPDSGGMSNMIGVTWPMLRERIASEIRAAELEAVQSHAKQKPMTIADRVKIVVELAEKQNLRPVEMSSLMVVCCDRGVRMR